MDRDDRDDELAEVLGHIEDNQESIMATVTDLETEVASLVSADHALAPVFQQVLDALKAAQAAGGLSAADQAKLDAAVTAVHGVAADVNAETAAGTAAAPGTQTPPPPVTSSLPEYLFSNAAGAVIDPAQWTAAGTAADGSQLYTFSGDTAGQPATGASADWSVYVPPAA